jgi:hypothetical protein
MNEDLRKWFREKWVRMDTKGNIKGDCAREPGEGKPKCLPLAKASAMDKVKRAAAVARKRREDPVADRPGKGGKPVNVATEEVSTSQLIKKSHSKRGAPGTLKAKIKGPITMEKVRSLKNRPGATTLDKKQANFYINMHSEEYLEEKNTPTNPSLWARAKALARSKFDVYPSAYANGWAAKWYKGKGGGWKSVQEGKQMKSLKDIIEGVAVSSDFKLVNTVDAQGKPTTRKVRAHRKTISPEKMNSEEKPDVLASIQKFVGRQYNEDVEQVDENSGPFSSSDYMPGKRIGGANLSSTSKKDTWVKTFTANREKEASEFAKKHGYIVKKRTYPAGHTNLHPHEYQVHKEEVEQVDEVDMSKTLAAYNKGKPEHAQAKIDTRTAAERKAETVKKLAAQKKPFNPVKIAPATKADMDKQIAKSYANHKPGQYVGDSVELDGEVVVEAKKSAAVRWQEALQRAKKQREEEEARKKENEKRALTPVKEQYVGTGQSKDMQRAVDAAHRDAEFKMMTKIYGDNFKDKPIPDHDTGELDLTSDGKGGYKASVMKTPKAKPQAAATNEAKDPREYDYEGDMAKTQLRSIIANSQTVHDMLKDTTNLAEWVQSKITKAEDYISTVADYMTAEMNESKKEDDDEDYSKHHKLDPDSGVEADQHIHVQLKKAIDSTMKPYEVTFKNGKKHSVSSPVAKTIVSAIEKLKPEHRKAVHDELHKSYDSLMGVHKMITGK